MLYCVCWFPIGGSWEYQDAFGHKYPVRQFYIATRDIVQGEEILHNYPYATGAETVHLGGSDPTGVEDLETNCAWFRHGGLSHDAFEALEFARRKFPGRPQRDCTC